MNRRSFAWKILLTLLLFALSVPSWAWPGKQVFPGVTYEHRSGNQDYGSGPYPQEIYIVYVDLNNPAISVVASRPEDRGMTTSKFAAKVGASVAINTNFFGSNFSSCGMAMGQGKLWTSHVYQSGESCADSVAFGPGNAIQFVHTAGHAKGPAPAGAHEVSTGMPTLVHKGVVVAQSKLESSDYPSHMKSAQPRTAMCLHEDKHTLILAVVDGRQPGTRTGMRAITLARFMKGLGCYEAVNFDGGGSSTMFVKGQKPYPNRPAGVVNRTSDGHERTVCCNLGIIVNPNPPPQDAGTDSGQETDAGSDASGDSAAEASTQDAGGDAGVDAVGDSGVGDGSLGDVTQDAQEGGAYEDVPVGYTFPSGEESSGCACTYPGLASNGTPVPWGPLAASLVFGWFLVFRRR